jgi:hypothetical protein
LLFEALLERLKWHEQQKTGNSLPKDEKKDETTPKVEASTEEFATLSDARLAR